MARFNLCVVLVICASILVVMASSPTTTTADAGDHFNPMGMVGGWVASKKGSGSSCKGSIAECMEAGEEEFDLDSEINRRILATTKYISYGALQRNTIPCSRRGASYYNCRPGAQANPYNRGCSAITRCRS
ncbi:rapid alkalinization factor [Arachis stenosperma]|uniref:rapid alkalinization factor n=1 Tax=Arachis stenosperma TaxID=217475 RepID=UPI0025ABEA8A|nr:rapid alkalinization factor [Arachis stenosperma]